jgi:hypothetical protein
VSDSKEFVIPLSMAGAPDGVSDETVRRYAKRLEGDGELDIKRTPTGRLITNFVGYQRLRAEILSIGAADKIKKQFR